MALCLLKLLLTLGQLVLILLLLRLGLRQLGLDLKKQKCENGSSDFYRSTLNIQFSSFVVPSTLRLLTPQSLQCPGDIQPKPQFNNFNKLPNLRQLVLDLLELFLALLDFLFGLLQLLLVLLGLVKRQTAHKSQMTVGHNVQLFKFIIEY